MPPKLDGVLESSLYVDDLQRSVRFYEEVFGFPVISDFGERGCAMHVGSAVVQEGSFTHDCFAARRRR